MKRIDTATRAQDLFGAGKDGFRDGDLANGIVPTDFNAKWCNQVQEEIANVIEEAGLELDENDRTQLLQAIGSLTGGRLLAVRVFSTAGALTFNKTPGALTYEAWVQGGGGAGGGTSVITSGQVAAGGGGRAGRCAYLGGDIADIDGAPLTVGAAGAAIVGQVGGNGGTSSIGALVSASGGGGGSLGAGGTASGYPVGGGGVSGSVSGAQISMVGGAGGYALYSNPAVSGKGGASFFGEGADVAYNVNGGNSAVSPGAGGSGGVRSSGTTATSGGNGAAGIILIKEYA